MKIIIIISTCKNLFIPINFSIRSLASASANVSCSNCMCVCVHVLIIRLDLQKITCSFLHCFSYSFIFRASNMNMCIMTYSIIMGNFILGLFLDYLC